MARVFRLQYSGVGIPIEVLEQDDSDDAVRALESQINKDFGDVLEIACGATDTNIRYSSYTTTTSGVSLDTIFSDTITGIDFLYVEITVADSSGTPDCQMDVNDSDSYLDKLSGRKDFTLVRCNALAGTDIKLKSSGSTTTAVVAILVGKEI